VLFENPAQQMQLSAVVLPAGEPEWNGQLLHVSDAMLAAYVPAAHKEHCAGPAPALKVPRSQALQVPPFAPVYPGLQRQLSSVLLAEPDKLLPGQVEQIAAPVLILYWPSAHAAQAVPSAPE
jgi:hypothetical protein